MLYKLGPRNGDVLTRIDGHAVTGPTELLQAYAGISQHAGVPWSLTTLHTNDAPTAISRLMEIGIEPFLLASSTILALGQRLVRMNCPACSRLEPVGEATLAMLDGKNTGVVPAGKGRGAKPACTRATRDARASSNSCPSRKPYAA